MDKIVHHFGKEARVFVTPEGVTGVVATSVPIAALDGLAEKLERRIAARQSAHATAPLIVQPGSASKD